MAFLWWQLLDDGVLAAVALVFGLGRYPGSPAGLGLVAAPARRWLGLGVAGGVGAAGAAWAIGAGLARWGWEAPIHPVEGILAAAEGPQQVLLVLVAVTGPVPLAEELFFRGLAYRVLRARLGVAAAVLVTGGGFAVVHGLAPGAWGPILPVGLVLAVLAERTGSLWPPVMAHAVVNALAVLVG